MGYFIPVRVLLNPFSPPSLFSMPLIAFQSHVGACSKGSCIIYCVRLFFVECGGNIALSLSNKSDSIGTLLFVSMVSILAHPPYRIDHTVVAAMRQQFVLVNQHAH